MNREIKFRAWDKEKEKMYDWEHIYNIYRRLDKEHPIGVTGREDDDSNIRLIDVILMQYTGLKDRNGKEIYEGDEVEVGKQFPSRDYVFFEKGMFRTKANAVGVFNEHCRIVGNKTDNSKILKETK